jgi:hypothetical protein
MEVHRATLLLVLAATCSTGLLAGASLDQSIKQLPARHRIGVVAFSTYSQAADLANGIWFYAVLGIGSAVLTLAAAFVVWRSDATPLEVQLALGAAALALVHSFTTTRAARLNFSQRRLGSDPAALELVFARFARWQAARAVLQVLNFVVLLWLLVEIARRSS